MFKIYVSVFLKAFKFHKAFFIMLCNSVAYMHFTKMHYRLYYPDNNVATVNVKKTVKIMVLYNSYKKYKRNKQKQLKNLQLCSTSV